MSSGRSIRTTYIAAFLLGALIALILFVPARAATPAAGDQASAARRVDSFQN